MAELVAHRNILTEDPTTATVETDGGYTNGDYNNGGYKNGGYTHDGVRENAAEEQVNGQSMMISRHALTKKDRKISKTSIGSKSSLTFRDVSVVINKKQILHRISGVAKVGDTLAIMGPSGAGKSTLLNVLGGRVPPTSGLVTFNGEPVTRKLRRKISYVLQADVFYPNLTLRETLTFALFLRLPDKMPREQKLRRMDEVVKALELNKCIDTIMGDAFITGLSGGERKRASIACELLTNPRIIILDEPTSGLDSAISYSLMDTLSKYALQSHKTVVTTIHQPSSQVFYMFSNVLLITDGHIAYYGPGNKVLDYFAKLGLHCQPHYNPADFLLEQVKSTPEVVKRIIDGAKALRRSPSDWSEDLKSGNESHPDEVAIQIDGNPKIVAEEKSIYVSGSKPGMSLNAGRISTVSTPESIIDEYHVEEDKWPTSFWSQYCVLTKRCLLRSKNRYLSKYKIGQMLFIALCVSLIWARTPRTESRARDRLGILFFIVVYKCFLSIMEGIFCIFDDYGVFMRERASGIYRLSSYYLACTTAELPSSICIPAVFVIISYFTTNLMPGPGNFFGCLLITILSVLTAQGIGILMGVVINDKLLSTTVAQCILIACMLAAGFYNANIPSWMTWIRYLSYLTYSMNGLAKVEFQYGDDIICNNPDQTIFPQFCSALSLSGLSTISINGSTVEAGLNATAAALSTIAPPTSQTLTIPGEEFVKEWDMDFAPLYGDVLVLFGIFVVVRIAAYIVLRIRRPGAKELDLLQCCRGKDKVDTDDD